MSATRCARATRGVPLLAAVVLLAACGDDNKGTNSSTSTPTSTTPSVVGGIKPPPSNSRPRPGTPGRPGSLVVGVEERDLYPLLGKSLVKFENQQVTGRSLHVLSTFGSETLWVGRGPAQRILVHIRTKGLAPPKLRGKKRVTFVGQLMQNEKGAATKYGATGASAALLDRQREHIEVSIGDLVFR